MKTFVKKLAQLRKAIEAQRGEFTLYALVLPEDAIVWDMLVAAKWIDQDQSAALKYLAKQIQNTLSEEELLNISGILLFDSNDIPNYGSSINSDNGWEENNIDFYGRQASKVYVFAAPVADFHVSTSQSSL